MKTLKAAIICLLACHVIDLTTTGGRYTAAAVADASYISNNLYYWALG